MTDEQPQGEQQTQPEQEPERPARRRRRRGKTAEEGRAYDERGNVRPADGRW
jgi:hypothetical protein